VQDNTYECRGAGTSRSMIDVITCDGKVSPMFLFEEYGGFNDPMLVRDVSRYCIERGWIPFLDYDSDFREWVFHSITCPAQDRIWRKPIAAKFHIHSIPSLSKFFGEQDLEDEFLNYLKSKTISCISQVRCKAGIADIVTAEKIYELKGVLTHSNLYKAIGQVQVYTQTINPKASMAILCHISSVPHLHPYANQFGIEIIEWLRGKRH
jgi:hypothetical protein